MKKVLTVIFDGFGMREEIEGNAIAAANMHTFNKLWDTYPHSLLSASAEPIGLMPGQMGNSEIGHMTIGAGRKIKSNIDKVNEFFTSDEYNEELEKLLSTPERRVHIIGLCSDGNVHSSLEHFLKMYDRLIVGGFKNIYFHLITDGRDTKVDVAYNYIKQINKKISEYKVGSIGTVCGRYYAMDRDSNYDRTKIYYDLITKGIGTRVLNIETSLKNSYEKNITDEFIKPIILDDNSIIKNEDIIIWINYRSDRSKQILRSFVDQKFDEFTTKNFSSLDVYTFYNFDKSIKSHVFIKDEPVDNPLGVYLSRLEMKQARVAESEKFPHVTYFFDGGLNAKIPGVDKYHVLSPEVPTYDQKPEMSAVGVTKKIIECMEKDYDFILANYANPDMVGHTGNMDATIKACMTLDLCLSKLIEAAEDNFYTIILLADHGNADTMLNDDGTICTTHSLSKVPFIIVDNKIKLSPEGDLTNVAPTILDYMNITIPNLMTGESLLIEE